MSRPDPDAIARKLVNEMASAYRRGIQPDRVLRDPNTKALLQRLADEVWAEYEEDGP